VGIDLTKVNIGVASDAVYPDGKSLVNVAKELESNYALFTAFALDNMGLIAESVTQSYAKSLFSNDRPDFLGADVVLSDEFQTYLMEGKVETSGNAKGDVPTKAALKGIYTQYQNGEPFSVETGVRRESFMDTLTLFKNLAVEVDYQ